MSRLVWVHGAWHASWCWEKVVPLLQEAGHEVVTVDLPGHGGDDTPVSEVTLEDRAVSPSLQKEMYERLPCRKVVSIDTSHSPFFSAPEELVGHLDSLARL